MPDYSISDFIKIKEFLDYYGINYTDGNYYNDDGTICGHWISIECDLRTDDLNQEDLDFNDIVSH